MTDEWGTEIEETPSETVETPEAPTPAHKWALAEALDYITYNAIDNEDYLDADDIAQVRYLNVAERTLKRKFKAYIVPNEATYLFAAVLAYAFNDTNKLAQQGQASFSFAGINVSFKDWSKKGLDALIPQEALDIIAEENGVSLTVGTRVRAVTL